MLFGLLWILNGAGQALVAIPTSTLVASHTQPDESRKGICRSLCDHTRLLARQLSPDWAFGRAYRPNGDVLSVRNCLLGHYGHGVRGRSRPRNAHGILGNLVTILLELLARLFAASDW